MASMETGDGYRGRGGGRGGRGGGRGGGYRDDNWGTGGGRNGGRGGGYSDGGGYTNGGGGRGGRGGGRGYSGYDAGYYEGGRGGGGGGRSGGGGGGYNNQSYNQNFYQGGRSQGARGRGYWGGRGGGGRGRGRGRSDGGGGGGGGGDRQAQAQREPPPVDLDFVAELKGHSKKVTSVLMDEASGQLFTGSHDGSVRVWSCTTGQCTSTVPVGGEVTCMLLFAGFLFVGLKTKAGAGQVKCWNTATNQEYLMEGHIGAVQALAAAGDMLFSAGQDASLRVWKLDAASGQWGCVAVLKVEQGGHRAPISCLWASHPFLFSADYLGTLKVWDLAAGVVRQTVEKAHSGTDVPCITDLTVWEGHIVSASLDGLIKIWEPADPASGLIINPTPIFSFPEQEQGQRDANLSGILSLCGVPDAQNRCVLMASYNGERCIRLWELPSFEPRGTLTDVNNARAMAGSASAQLVFSGDEHGRVKVWKWKAVGPGGFPITA
ncbi:Zinc finger CCCH domain-containing protein 17 [Chlorella vulgaris]